jgi:hypothetical protein
VLLGIAGSPGAGRSTLAAGLAEALRTRGIPVASVPVAGAIAVEPAALLLLTEGNYLLDESEQWGDVRRMLTAVSKSPSDTDRNPAVEDRGRSVTNAGSEGRLIASPSPSSRNRTINGTTVVRGMRRPAPSAVRLSSPATRTAGLSWASICGKWQAKVDVAFRDAHARMRCRSAASALSRMRRAGR